MVRVIVSVNVTGTVTVAEADVYVVYVTTNHQEISAAGRNVVHTWASGCGERNRFCCRRHIWLGLGWLHHDACNLYRCQ